MCYEILKAAEPITTVMSVLAAIFSGICAYLSYKLSCKIRNELQSDERIITGVPIHPNLTNNEHSHCIIQCTLFNKSKRKDYINRVEAYDDKDNQLDVTWSDQIDNLGNLQNPCQLIGIVDSCSLFIRRNAGVAINFARIEIRHSFSDTSMVVIFDEFAELEKGESA